MTRRVRLRPDRAGMPEATLPADLRAGDVIAIPCRGGTALADVRGRSSRPAAERRKPHQGGHDDEQPWTHCGR
ncbi:hypothetical protein [Agromyces italicus]|uniref:hypothetical protein n=1 Tax=Agromyces italicus TaxID=279572 RepID=UPI0012F9E764|nr:hypothetical protein [Agromyces italicus]